MNATNPNDEPDLSGQIFDRYRLIRLLGIGGMGAVYEAEHTTLEKRVAVKLLRQQFTMQEVARKRFLREAKAATRVKHPNVVDISDFGQTPEGRVYFVMEMLAGRDLREVLDREPRLPWPRVQNIMIQTVSALEAAHTSGIVHRDMKPSNCFLVDAPGLDGQDFIKVLDFGIAKYSGNIGEETQGLTSTDEIFGTVGYMAPEMAMGTTTEPRSDIYALGVMMYQMLVGDMPFKGNTAFQILAKHVSEPPPRPRDTMPSIPEGVEAIILKAMAKDLDARFATMKDFREALRQGGLVAPPPLGPPPMLAVPAGAPQVAATLNLSGPMDIEALAAQGPPPALKPPPLGRPKAPPIQRPPSVRKIPSIDQNVPQSRAGSPSAMRRSAAQASAAQASAAHPSAAHPSAAHPSAAHPSAAPHSAAPPSAAPSGPPGAAPNDAAPQVAPTGTAILTQEQMAEYVNSLGAAETPADVLAARAHEASTVIAADTPASPQPQPNQAASEGVVGTPDVDQDADQAPEQKSIKSILALSTLGVVVFGMMVGVSMSLSGLFDEKSEGGESQVEPATEKGEDSKTKAESEELESNDPKDMEGADDDAAAASKQGTKAQGDTGDTDEQVDLDDAEKTDNSDETAVVGSADDADGESAAADEASDDTNGPSIPNTASDGSGESADLEQTGGLDDPSPDATEPESTREKPATSKPKPSKPKPTAKPKTDASVVAGLKKRLRSKCKADGQTTIRVEGMISDKGRVLNLLVSPGGGPSGCVRKLVKKAKFPTGPGMRGMPIITIKL